MQLEFGHHAKKSAAAGLLLSATAFYLALSTTRFLASYLGDSTNRRYLRLAARLDGGDADYSDGIGLYELLARQSPQAAVRWLQSATDINPHSSKYWLDLAMAQQALGDVDAEKRSLAQAATVDPHTPDVAWQVANLYLAQGSLDEAMRQFHSVLENNPPVTGVAITSLWKIRPDIDYLLDNVIPPAAYSPLLEFLISRKETAAAGKLWERMANLQQPVERRYVFGYLQYLLASRQPEQAALVWQQAGSLSDLAAYEPSSENLLVNGDFSLEMLNAGFDWRHRATAGVSLALDPSETHSSSRSLRLTFEGPGIDDAGIAQMVAVDPNTKYDFSGFYRAEGLDGAGGLEFAIQDAYSGSKFFMGEDLRDVDYWKKTGGSFVTGPDTHLVMLSIARVPSGRPIRGKLWIDGLRLIPSESSEKEQH